MAIYMAVCVCERERERERKWRYTWQCEVRADKNIAFAYNNTGFLYDNTALFVSSMIIQPFLFLL